jgi:hypothetical protein
MRKSRVLLAGVAVAAAGAATSAFTAGNTFAPGVDGTVAGYGEATVSGANITAIDYNRAADQTLLASVVWHSDTPDLGLEVAADDASMTLRDADGDDLGVFDCVIAGADEVWTITCTVGTVPFAAFTTAGLAVGGSSEVA